MLLQDLLSWGPIPSHPTPSDPISSYECHPSLSQQPPPPPYLSTSPWPIPSPSIVSHPIYPIPFHSSWKKDEDLRRDTYAKGTDTCSRETHAWQLTKGNHPHIIPGCIIVFILRSPSQRHHQRHHRGRSRGCGRGTGPSRWRLGGFVCGWRWGEEVATGKCRPLRGLVCSCCFRPRMVPPGSPRSDLAVDVTSRWLCTRPATSVQQVKCDQQELGLTELDMGRSLFLLS